jgi:hypothetical protein
MRMLLLMLLLINVYAWVPECVQYGMEKEKCVVVESVWVCDVVWWSCGKSI